MYSERRQAFSFGPATLLIVVAQLGLVRTDGPLPYNVRASNLSLDHVEVTWDSTNSSIAVSFWHVYYKLLKLDGTLVSDAKEEFVRVSGINQSVIMANLSKHSTYSISVQSFISENFGSVSRSAPLLLQTPVGRSDAPRNLEVKVLSGVDVYLDWDAPIHFWGTFEYFQVECAPASQSFSLYPDCNATKQSFCKVKNLIAYTDYYFMVSAVTNGGQGLGITNQTRTVPILLLKVDNTVEMLLKPHPSAIYHQVVVRRLLSDYFPSEQTKDIPPSQLRSYQHLGPNETMFVAAVLLNADIEAQRVFKIGTGSESTYANLVYRNVPLLLRSKYTFFQRTYMNDGSVVSYDWLGPVDTYASVDKDDDVTENEIVLITVGVAIAVIAVIFVIFCGCVYKYSLKYAPLGPPKKPKQKEPLDSAIPITERDFYDHTTQMKFSSFRGFYEEFSRMGNESRSSEASSSSKNLSKSRDIQIPCYDETRVTLKDAANDFIHANYVEGYTGKNDYIATQAPLAETVSDFWTMVWEQNVNKIVMIANIQENGQRVCEVYWPDESTPMFSYCVVRLVSSKECADHAVRRFSLSRPGLESREVVQFQFKSWPAIENTPKYPTAFLDFWKLTQTVPCKPGSPVVVHCVTGSGRSGVFIAVDAQTRRLAESHDLNLFDQVETIRACRFDGIKTLDEYIFIHDVILEYLLLRHLKPNKAKDLPAYIDNSKKNSTDVIRDEYDLLKLTVIAAVNRCDAAMQPCNAMKNRFDTSLPYDDNRVTLSYLQNVDGSDYINASFIDTYLRKRAFITAQSPLESTVGDFWRMIWEHQSWIIVMFGQEIEDGLLRAHQYWPDEGFVVDVGGFAVKLRNSEEKRSKDVIVRQLELVRNETSECRLVQHYQYLRWPSYEDMTSEGISSLVFLTHEIEAWRTQLRVKHVTVHSSSGIGRTGVFIALQCIKEETEAEGFINVFGTVHKLRQQRTGLVQTLEQYKLIYSAALEITKNVRRQALPETQVIDDGLKVNSNSDAVPTKEPDNVVVSKPSKFSFKKSLSLIGKRRSADDTAVCIPETGVVNSSDYPGFVPDKTVYDTSL